MEHYITQIKIEELLHLSNLCIELRQDMRTNLLLTGKNGSGKTTLLRAIKRYLQVMLDENARRLEWLKRYHWLLMSQKNNQITRVENEADLVKEDALDYGQKKYKKYSGLEEYFWNDIKAIKEELKIDFNEECDLKKFFNKGNFILAYYGADRKIGITRQKNAEDVDLSISYSMDDDLGSLLLKYLIHLKTQQAYAKNENDMSTVDLLDQWFDRFVNALKVLLDDSSVEMKYDYKNYNFEIIEDGRGAFGFDQLSDGYSAALQIFADLLLRMEQNWLKKGELSSYDVEGIVIIDELETHLHIALQKTILPFLTSFFPKIQFIISTHSPYILNSIENCVIYDLENRVRMENMSNYSAEGIVEGYFELDSYSETLLEKVKRYQKLVETVNPTDEERAERATLYTEFKQLSGDLSREAREAFEEIEDRRKQNDKIQS